METYCFSGAKHNLTLALLSGYVQENPSRENTKTFLLEIDESIGNIAVGQSISTPHIGVDNEPLHIKIYDNDCKYITSFIATSCDTMKIIEQFL